MNIRQFSGTYLPNDDRIIFRFNTTDQSEYKFWLTRKVTRFILVSTSKFFEQQHDKQAPSFEKIISEFQQPFQKTKSNFLEEYQSGSKFPLGAESILVIDARCQITKIDDQEIFSLDFILPGGANVNLKLPMDNMQKLVLLLEQLNTEAKW